LIFIPKLTKSLNCFVTFDGNKCLIQDVSSQKRIGVADLLHGLYVLTMPSVSTLDTPYNPCIEIPHKSINALDKCDRTIDCNLWHMRFGHPSFEKLNEINKVFPSVSVQKTSLPCDICFYAKQKRLPFSLSQSISTHIFDLVHMDIWGPLSIPSISGFKYFLTIVDDKSRFTWIYLMKLKSETPTLIQNFVKMVHTQFNTKIKCIRSDNGHEFKLSNFYHGHGIVHQNSCVATPQ
jgi:hypothetical protein